MGITADTRNHVNQMYDFEDDCINPDGLDAAWQTSGTLKICRLALNLWNGYAKNDAEDYTPYELFETSLAPYMVEAIKVRYPSCFSGK